MSVVTESDIEQIVLDLFGQALDYDAVLSGPELAPDGSAPERQDYGDVVLRGRLKRAIDRLNPDVPPDLRAEALLLALRTPSLNLLTNNEAFHNLLTEGVDVRGTDANGSVRTYKVWLIDFNAPARNEFVAVNQLTIIEKHVNKRPDVVVFVNGLPLVVIELKNATDEQANVRAAFNQLQTYQQAIPSLFTYNALLIASDGWFAKAGTLTSDWSRFLTWKTPRVDAPDGPTGTTARFAEEPQLRYDSALFPGQPRNELELEVMLRGMLNKATLLDLLRHFIVFERTNNKSVKKVAAYHQYYAVNKAIRATVRAASLTGDQRVGVVWHTQGSGKSLSMVFYAGKLVVSHDLNNPTLVVLTDRNDLDQQLFDTFSNCQQLIRQTPVQADDREHLRRLLSVASGGVVFTTIQKFMPDEKGATYPKLSDRRNIVVIADEAHRSQYDFVDGYARHMRDALPQASFIGFTGTPIEREDASTKQIFGDYIDVYDIQQAVEDGATVRIFYENRLAKIDLDEAERNLLDERVEELTEEEELTERQKRFSRWTQREAIVGSDKRLRQIAADIVRHFEQRSETFDGKGMIVSMSRRIAVLLHDELVKLRPDWYNPEDDKGVLKVIMTGSSSDPLAWQEHIRNKPRRKAIGDRLKNPADELKLVIVRDMWLTGFDAPCLHTLYVDKQMNGHNLMQAIARVNRVFKDKEGGLIVDYIGIAQDLKRALSTYTDSGGKGQIEYSKEEAVARMQEEYEKVVDLFGTFDYRHFFDLSPKDKLVFLLDATEFVLDLDRGRERFNERVTTLSKAFALAVPHASALAIRDDLSFFQAIKARIVKLRESQQKRSNEEVETAIRQIISNALVSSEVVDIYEAAGMDKPEIPILSDEFLAELKGMPRKNLALELLKRLLNDEIKSRSDRNVVQSRKFSEMLTDAVKRYQTNLLTAAEIMDELVQLAKDLWAADQRGEKLNLDYREIAFYDALSDGVDMQDEVLRSIARELVEAVRNSATIDWTVKESVQAKMRVLVKRILKKYGYPPEKQEGAIKTVLEQAKLMAGDLATA